VTWLTSGTERCTQERWRKDPARAPERERLRRGHQIGHLNPPDRRIAAPRPTPHAARAARMSAYDPRTCPPILQRKHDAAGPPTSARASIYITASARSRNTATIPFTCRISSGVSRAMKRPNSVGTKRGLAVLLRCRQPQSIHHWQERTKMEPTQFADTVRIYEFKALLLVQAAKSPSQIRLKETGARKVESQTRLRSEDKSSCLTASDIRITTMFF